MDYLHCYEVLGLNRHSDWETALRRYRQLAARHHPDRADHESDAGSFAFAEVNYAYRTLRKYYQLHGRLPLQSQAVVHPVVDTRPFSRPPARRSTGRPLILTSVLALLFFGYYNSDNRAQAPGADTAADVTATRSNTRAGTLTTADSVIVPGDPLGHVAQLLGPPEDSAGSRWYYGASWIQFKDGRVIDWYSSAERPLPVNLAGRRASGGH